MLHVCRLSSVFELGHLLQRVFHILPTPGMQRELTRVRMAQTLRGDLTSQEEADLIDLLAEKVGSGCRSGRERATSTKFAIEMMRRYSAFIARGCYALWHGRKILSLSART